MSVWNGDASDIYRAAGDLSRIGARSLPVVRGVMGEMGKAFEKDWRDNARQTAGEHGKHYPDSIESRPLLSISSVGVEVGPNPGKRQGGMSFEYGSANQPPHLDGLRALDGIGPRVEKALDAAVGHLFDE